MDELEKEKPQDEDLEEEINRLTGKIAHDKPESPNAPPKQKLRQHPLILPLTIVLLVFSILLTIANLAGLGPFRRDAAPLNPRSTLDQQELDLLAITDYIEGFYHDRHRLPASLDECGIDVGNEVEYQPLDENSYSLLSKGGEPLIYRISGESRGEEP